MNAPLKSRRPGATDEKLFFWRPGPVAGDELAGRLRAEIASCARAAKLSGQIRFPRGADIWSARAEALRWVARNLKPRTARQRVGLLLALLALTSGCTVTHSTTEMWQVRRTSFLQRVEMPEVQIANATVADGKEPRT